MFFLLWQQFEQEILALPLLLQVVRGPLLHEGLQVVGVLLHAGEEVVKDVAALAVPGNRGEMALRKVKARVKIAGMRDENLISQLKSDVNGMRLSCKKATRPKYTLSTLIGWPNCYSFSKEQELPFVITKVNSHFKV